LGRIRRTLNTLRRPSRRSAKNEGLAPQRFATAGGAWNPARDSAARSRASRRARCAERRRRASTAARAATPPATAALSREPEKGLDPLTKMDRRRPLDTIDGALHVSVLCDAHSAPPVNGAKLS
jgi:hypothetical protein